MLSEINQLEKDNHHMVSLMWNIRNSEIQEIRERRGTECFSHGDFQVEILLSD